MGISFGCSDNWASVAHLEHGLSRRPTQSMGLQIEAKEGASERELEVNPSVLYMLGRSVPKAS